jgi:hypothetical protein
MTKIQLRSMSLGIFDGWITDRDEETGQKQEGQNQERTGRNQENQNQERTSQNPPKKDLALEKIDRLYLKLCIALLNHELGDDEYESVIISGLAVLGFRDDGGWLNVEDYTTNYSGVINRPNVGVVPVVYRSRGWLSEESGGHR